MVKFATAFRASIVLTAIAALLLFVTAPVLGQSDKTAGDITRIMPVKRMLTVVPPDVQAYETFSHPKPIAGINPAAYDPNYLAKSATAKALTSNVITRHDVGCLEFTYKPLRWLEVDIPAPGGKMHRKTVAYLVYRVRNLGGHLTSEESTDEFGYKAYAIKKADEISEAADVKTFEPHIVLEGWLENFTERTYYKKAYLETYHPYVVKQIERVDRTPGNLHDWYSISQDDIEVTKDENALGTWGVAIWEDVDPNINYVSIFVQGLTNAYQVSEQQDGSATFRQKTLQINFWRAGTAKSIKDDVVTNGIPMSGTVEEQAIYAKFYGLPGPAVKAYEMEVGTDRSMPLFEVDADFNAQFDSVMINELKKDQLPGKVHDEFVALGIPVPQGTPIVNKIPGIRWEFQIRDGERIREFRLDHESRYWVKKGKGVEILNPVENLWIYR